MTHDCKNPRITATCEDKVIHEATTSGSCQSWETCLPFGGRLYNAGGCVHFEKGSPPADGVYDKIVIANGCIVGAEKGDIPLYTGSPCAPVPVECGGGGGLPDPSGQSGNLFAYDASGKPLVRVVISGGDGISVSGNGSASSPYIIALSGAGGGGGKTFIRSANNAIAVTGAGEQTAPYVLTHKKGLEGRFGGMTFDDYGHLVSFTQSSVQTGVAGIIGGAGINVTSDSNGIYTISATGGPLGITGDYLFGGWNAKFQDSQLVGVTQSINVAPGVYTFGDYKVTVNKFGSITGITGGGGGGGGGSSGGGVMVHWGGFPFSFTLQSSSQLDITYETNGLVGTATLHGISAEPIVYIDGVQAGTFSYIGIFTIPPSAGSTGTEKAVKCRMVTPTMYSAGSHTITIEDPDKTFDATRIRGYTTITPVTVI